MNIYLHVDLLNQLILSIEKRQSSFPKEFTTQAIYKPLLARIQEKDWVEVSSLTTYYEQQG